MTDKEIDEWIETDSLCLEAAARGATLALGRMSDLMFAYLVTKPEHKTALIEFLAFAERCSTK